MATAKDQQEMLLVEENHAESRLLHQLFLEYLQVPYQLHVVPDGDAALAFLHQAPPAYTTAPRPHLILLDVRLPKWDGWEVLAAIRARPAVASIPVVILTGGSSPREEENRVRFRPTLCLPKPFGLEGYRQLVKTIEEILRSHTAAV